MLIDDLITVATVEAIRLADDLATVLGDALIDAPKERFRPWRLSRLLADPAWLSRTPNVRLELTALRDAADPIIRSGTRTEQYLNDSGGLSTSTEISDDARL